MSAAMLRTLALIGLASLLVSCGSSTPVGDPITSGQVRDAFRSEGIQLRVVVDSRTLDERRIHELTRGAATTGGVVGGSLRAYRTGLEQVRARAKTHPVVWLVGRANAPAVIVYGKERDAAAALSATQRGARRLGMKGRLPFTRVRNVFVVSIGVKPKARPGLDAALRRLRRS